MSSRPRPARILLLGPNRWPRGTEDPLAGLQIRRSLIADNVDLDVTFVLVEDEPPMQDLTAKLVALLTDPQLTHVFLLWPKDAKMAGTQDELIVWQVVGGSNDEPPECDAHRRGLWARRVGIAGRVRSVTPFGLDAPSGVFAP